MTVRYENPANDHLKIKRPLPELPAEEEKEAQPTDVIRNKQTPRHSRAELSVCDEAGGREVCRRRVKTFGRRRIYTLTIEQIGDNYIAISHYYGQNGDAMADPDMGSAYDNERKRFRRTYQPRCVQNASKSMVMMAIMSNWKKN